MFRDLKEYQEIQELYNEKVSKPEKLDERRGSSSAELAQNRKKLFPATPPQKGAGGGVGNPTNVRGSGVKPKPEIKKFPTTAEIRAANPNAVGGGNAGGSTDSGGTSQSTIKSVEQKPEIKKPEPKPQSKFMKRERGKVGFVKRGTPGAQRAENQERQRERTKEMFKKRQEAKAAGKPQLSGKERAQQMAKERLAKKAAMEEYTPYDYVLEYLLSSEQAATIEEANYVMTEMDAETIQGIVEEQKKNLDEGIKTMIGIGAALATPYLMKKFGKPKTDKVIDKERKTNKIGGEYRSGNTEFKQGVNAIKDAKKKGGGLMNQSTRDALKMLD